MLWSIAVSPLLCGGAVCAQQDQGGGGGQPLAGPSVSDRAARTLVAFNAEGRFIRIEGRPEEAALRLLALNQAQRDTSARIADEYAADLGLLLVDNLDTVRAATDAIKAGDREKATGLYRELYDAFEPGNAKGEHHRDPIAERLGETLSEPQRADLSRLLDEYWKAWIDWELRNSKDKSEPARQRTQKRLVFAMFQEEARRAYERVLLPYVQRIDAIYAAVEPTDEQREAIRAVVIDFIRVTRLKPTAQQRQEVMRRVYLLLDEERRAKLFDLVVEMAGQ